MFGVSRRAALWLATMVPAGLFIVSGLLIFWLVNKPSVADFMIAAEGEIKKVSWSSRKEIAVSTFIVIVVVVVMAVLLGTTDLVFFQLFSWLLG
ncbi:MAG: preprotein translocase subunit SecE [Planctomycetota bacterium]